MQHSELFDLLLLYTDFHFIEKVMQKTDSNGFELHKPAEIALLVDAAGVTKARLPLVQTLSLAILAGVFIALGAAAYAAVMTGVDASFGPARFLGGIVFSLGLILVVVGGAELFTGNSLMVMATVDRLITPGELAKNWVIVYFGNFIGAIFAASMIWLSGIVSGSTADFVVSSAMFKTSLSWTELFIRGIWCNVLVCLAIWLSLAARTVVGKIMAIIWPVSTFVLLGFEHSVANMYLIPQGMLAGAPVTFEDLFRNLVFVTFGNIVGGGGGVALAYHFAYGKYPNA